MVLEALGKPSCTRCRSSCPSASPRRRPTSRSTSYTGSGPYIFKKDEFRPGEKVVYMKNTDYVPRTEPPSGTAGGKQVYVDRVEWIMA